MKKLSLLITILCLVAGISRSATLTGTIINGSTLAPVPGFRVYVRDSFNVYKDSALTIGNGTYSITLPGSVTGNRLIVSVQTCGYQFTAVTYTGGSVTANFSVCYGTPLYNLQGTVTLGGATNNGVAKLYLIRKQYDTTISDTTLTAIDSFNTVATGGMFSKTYSSIPYGSLLLKAALVSSHPSYSGYLPTYYGGSLVWSNAARVDGALISASTTNINMIGGTNPGGLGFIGGSVLVGANKSAAVGDPLSSRILLLTTSTGQAVAYTYSNASGKFSFTSVAFGTYKIFGDAWGKSNPALTLTLTAAKPGMTNIIFEENDTTFKGRFGSLSVSSSALSNVAVFPNPVTELISFIGLNNIAGGKSVILRNSTGAALLRQSFNNGEQVSIATGRLPAGVYLLQLQTEAGVASFQVVK